MIKFIFVVLIFLQADGIYSTRSTGCGKDPPHPFKPGHSHDLEVQISDPVGGEVTRKVRIHVPRHYNKDVDVGVVIDYHGFTGNAHWQEKDSRFIDVADEDEKGFIVLTGHGMQDNPEHPDWGSWNSSRTDGPLGPPCDTNREKFGEISCYSSCEYCDRMNSCDWATCFDDILYTRTIIDAALDMFCINEKSIHMSGVSNGGLFLYYAISQFSDQIASIAPIASSPLIGFGDVPTSGVSVIDFHGTLDDTIPYDPAHSYGEGPYNSVVSYDGYFYEAKADTLSKWAAGLGCDNGEAWPTEMDGITEFACNIWSNCIDSTEIVHCSAKHGHDYPFGETDQYIEGTRILWNFMKNHEKQ